MNSPKIFNHIQTLRGFSVFIVFLYHTNIEIFSSGYLGVDIFFVISGYVISSRILNNENFSKNIDIKNFYIKRVKRIIPNLFFIVLTCYVAYLFLAPPDQSLFNETLFSLLGISNLYYINHSRDYFDNIFVDPLGHTWSLGVEEQFYIFFPILIFLIFNFSKQRIYRLKIFFIIILIFSLLLNFLNYKTNPQFSFYFSPFRFWEFLFGSLAFIYKKNLKKNKHYFVFSIIIMLSILIFDNNINYFIKNLLTVICATIFIINYSEIKIIENKNFVYLGNISYSFYLWHLPVIFFCDLYFINDYQLDVFLSFLITLFLSSLTYKYIEQKFRYISWNNTFNSKQISIIILACFLSVVYVKYFNNNLRIYTRSLITNLNYPQIKLNWLERGSFINLIKIEQNKAYKFCTPNSIKFTINKFNLREECLKFKNTDHLFFIKGDSHTAQFLPIFNQSKIIDNFYFTASNNSSFSNFDNKLSNYFSKIYLVTNLNNSEELKKTKKEFLNLSKNLNLIIFNSRPTSEQTFPFKCLVQQRNCTIDRKKNIKENKLEKFFYELNEFKKENKNRVFIFDSYGSLCPAKKSECIIYDKEKDILYYRDKGHLLPEGAKTIIPQFEEFLKRNKII